MRAVHVTGMGAFTPVGINVPQTMGSLVSRLQWFDDLDLLGPTGVPVAGARVRLAGADDPTERYVAMSRFALAECRADDRASHDRHPIPLMLATSRARDLPCEPHTLLGLVLDAAEEATAARNGPRLDREASRVFAAGRQGALDALAAASELVSSGRAAACYAGGVDSLLDPVRLNELLADGRLVDGSGRDGFLPGEAAVFVKLSGDAAVDGATLLASSTADDVPSAADPLPAAPSGAALARAGLEALRGAGLDASRLGALVHDGSLEASTVEDVAMAISRLPFGAGGTSLRPWTPAYSVGETGAASAWLSIAMTTFFLRERVFAGPALVCLFSEGSRRTALVIGQDEAKEGRRG